MSRRQRLGAIAVTLLLLAALVFVAGHWRSKTDQGEDATAQAQKTATKAHVKSAVNSHRINHAAREITVVKKVLGIAGPPGARGHVGLQGLLGPQGKLGLVGPRGATGASGQVGATGPAGEPGSVGPQGAAGVHGDVGPEGSSGAPGAPGERGPQGEPGPAGPEGPPGPPGPPGPEGPPGSTPTTLTCTETETPGVFTCSG